MTDAPRGPLKAPQRSPAASKPRGKSWRGRLLRRLAYGTAIAGVWVLIGAVGVVVLFATDLPDVDAAMEARRRPAVTLLAADGTELVTIGDLYGPPMQLQDLPKALPRAVIATEDRRFYSHFGIDPVGLVRAAVVNLKSGRIVQGGSTITQQAAKNLFLTSERKFKRKVQEVMLAVWLERRLTKDQILTIYLNRVYFGAGTYGVEAAAQRYFGRSARTLNTFESAMLAGLLKAPSRYNPHKDPELAAKRTSRVLDNMVAAGLLSQQEAQAAARVGSQMAGRPRPSGLARHFADWVLDQVPGYAGSLDRDLVIRTTLDPALQRQAEAIVDLTLDREGQKQTVEEAALLALTPTGAIRAMVGGRSYAESQFNRATQAVRQPGSAFKPIVYLAALEAGFTPSTPVTDSPIRIDGYQPRNFDDGFRGAMRLDEALAYSVNTVAVDLAEKVGRTRVIAAAKRLGITADIKPTPSLALGTAETTLLELTSAYGVFASGGFGVWPYGIEEIRTREGAVLYRRMGDGAGRVADAHHVGTMGRMLASVIEYGTGRQAQMPRGQERPLAGKTGTSQNFRDAWFVGYSADLAVGVWCGNDDDSPMRRVTGGGLPAQIWRDFMAAAHRGLPPRALPAWSLPPVAEKPKKGIFDFLFSSDQQSRPKADPRNAFPGDQRGK
ncbi:MAG: penicillin-binding protein 1A [Rhodospirillales bacterium]|nr:penicillin-binding protein 1A [Rhodospirillales bacterium]